MGFNKKYVKLESSLSFLEKENLQDLYKKNDLIIFEDKLSSDIYELFKQGKTEKEIILILKISL